MLGGLDTLSYHPVIRFWKVKAMKSHEVQHFYPKTWEGCWLPDACLIVLKCFRLDVLFRKRVKSFCVSWLG